MTAYTIGKDVVQVASVFYGGFAAKGKQLGEETGGRVRMGPSVVNKFDNIVDNAPKNGIADAIKQFGDDVVEEALEVATDQVAAKGKKFTWPEIQAMFKRGNEFNKTGGQNYIYNEITLENGKRLDSYVPRKEIVSRKATTLSAIKQETFERYLKELTTKYEKGKVIKSPKYKTTINGTTLEGEYFLEIPASNREFTRIKQYEELALKHGITIKYLNE